MIYLVVSVLKFAALSFGCVVLLDVGPCEDDGCSGNEQEQTCSSTRKNIPWHEIDEQRLRVYREEGKLWKRMFKQFPIGTEPRNPHGLDNNPRSKRIGCI
jgi:hypothetical protein